MKNTVMFNGRKIELDQKTIDNKDLTTALATAYTDKNRYRIWYGDAKTGRSWNEEYEVMGKISSSMSEIACLILINKSNSFGGGTLLDSSIIRIDRIDTKQSIYKHPDFHTGLQVQSNMVYQVVDGILDLFAVFSTDERANNFLSFMNGDRYSK